MIFLVENKPSENVYTNNTHKGKPEIPDLNVPGNDVDLECDRIIENSTNYVETGETYERKTTNVDIFFAAKIAKIIDLDPEPKSLLECKKHSDWSKWNEAIKAELNSLYKRQVFGPVGLTPEGVYPVGYKWVFV